MIDSTAGEYNIVVSEACRAEDREAIYRPLIAYNCSVGPDPGYGTLALLIQDSAGAVSGGLWGRIFYDWLVVELLFIPEPLRRTGLGRRLLSQAEQHARDRGCIGIWLDTFSFQARPFYEKLGFTVFGQLDDYPQGMSRYWLQKRLD
jgi:GNAT superfamily N-acetyltransferase